MNALSFASTLSEVSPGLEPPVGPPNMSNNSVSITSSASALPVNTLVPSKNVVVPVSLTFKTSVARSEAN